MKRSRERFRKKWSLRHPRSRVAMRLRLAYNALVLGYKASELRRTQREGQYMWRGVPLTKLLPPRTWVSSTRICLEG